MNRRFASAGTRALAALLCAALVAATAVQRADADTTGSADTTPDEAVGGFRVLYNGYFLGFLVMKASVDAAMTSDRYAARAVFRTAGLLGFFNDSEINADANGVRAASGLKPRAYHHRNLKSKKDRRIAVAFSDADVEATVTPPFGSQGDPPATAEQRLAAADPISAFLQIVYPHGADACDRRVPVFDGKQRYDLRFELIAREEISVRGYDGPAFRCHVFYEPVAGFDPEDLAEPEVYETPFDIWLADLGAAGLTPVRIRGAVSGLRVSVEAKSLGAPLEAAADLRG